MAIFSSFNLIRGLAVFHFSIAYFLIASPAILTDQTIVLILGEAMNMPHVTSFDRPNPATAFLALLFAFLAFTDLTAVSMTEHVAYHYWGSQTPVRLLFLMLLTGYTYVTKPETSAEAFGQKYLSLNPLDNLKNGLVFSWAFIECSVYFMIYLALKDEGKQRRQRT